ncbi:MAG: hypothetical protein P1U58_12265 [Verrucomicrobiales bacterium]|nr:hypothetical protein [Verrucomicrobiales bacterium]
MGRFTLHLFFTLLVTLQFSETTAKAGDNDYCERLITKDGREFSDCRIKRADEEGLIIEHSEGIARISFFDLSNEMQERFDFDPVAAMQAFRKHQKTEQETLKQRTLALTQIRAEAERKAADEELQKRVIAEWTPVEAHIISVRENGAYAIVRKVYFEPTTVVSKLGLKRPGPPKRLTTPIGSGPLFLQCIAHEFATGSSWNGYIEPSSTHRVTHPDTGEKSVPVHLAVPPP